MTSAKQLFEQHKDLCWDWYVASETAQRAIKRLNQLLQTRRPS